MTQCHKRRIIVFVGADAEEFGRRNWAVEAVTKEKIIMMQMPRHCHDTIEANCLDTQFENGNVPLPTTTHYKKHLKVYGTDFSH